MKNTGLLFRMRWQVLGILLLGLFASAAVAAEANNSLFRDAISWIIGVPQGDLKSYIVSKGQSTSVLSTMSLVLNSATLFITVVIGLWTLLSGTLSTAKEGEVLGRRYDSAWVPIRSVVAIAALMPLGGYSAIQLFFIGVVGSGWHLADQVAAKRIEHLQTRGAEILPKMPKAGELALKIAQSRICQVVANDGPDGKTNVVINTYTGSSGGFEQLSLSFDGVSGSGYPLGACGQLSIVYRKPEANESREAAMAAVSKAAYEAAVTMAESEPMTELVKSVLDPASTATDDDRFKLIQKIALIYETRVSAAAGQYITKLGVNQAFFDNILNLGWISHGAINWTIKNINDTIIELALIEPQVSAASIGEEMPITSQKDYLAAVGTLQELGKNYVKYIGLDKYGFPSLNQGAGVVNLAGETGFWDEVRLTVSKFFVDATQAVVNYLQAGSLSKDSPSFNDYLTTDPVRQLKQVGDTLIVGGEMALGAAIVGNAVGDSIKSALSWLGPLGSIGGGALKGLSGGLAMILGLLAFYLFFFGITLAMYIPAIPFIYWIAGVYRILMLMVAAFLGVPVWAAAHAIPEGEGIAGQHARAGYLILIALLARPMFMVFGIVAGDLLFKAMSIIMGILFVPAMQSVNTGSVMGILTLMFNIALFVIMSVGAARTAYSLIHRLGDWAMRFVGGNIEGLGEEQEEREHHSAFVGIVHTTRQAAAGRLPRHWQTHITEIE